MKLLTVVFGLGLLPVQSGAPTAKVTFLRGQALVVANADGTAAREIVTDPERKDHPVWSPDGTRIMYNAPGRTSGNPLSHATLVVVDSQGKLVARVPVLSTLADGTKVEGMRGVETSGWYSNSVLFAEGTPGPYMAEYRLLGLDGRERGGYFVEAFSTCGARGEVAYAEYLRDLDAERQGLDINDSKVFTVERTGTEIHDVMWSRTCDRLLLVLRENTAWSVVVLRNRAVEARLPVANEMNGATIAQSGDTFLLIGSSRALVYDPATRSLKPGDAARQELDERRAIVERLGGRQPDWWVPSAALR